MPNDNMGDFNVMPYEEIAEDSLFAYDGDGDERMAQFRMPGGMRSFDRMRDFGRMRGFGRDRDFHIHHFHHFDRDFDDLFPFLFFL